MTHLQFHNYLLGRRLFPLIKPILNRQWFYWSGTVAWVSKWRIRNWLKKNHIVGIKICATVANTCHRKRGVSWEIRDQTVSVGHECPCSDSLNNLKVVSLIAQIPPEKSNCHWRCCLWICSFLATVFCTPLFRFSFYFQNQMYKSSPLWYIMLSLSVILAVESFCRFM